MAELSGRREGAENTRHCQHSVLEDSAPTSPGLMPSMDVNPICGSSSHFKTKTYTGSSEHDQVFPNNIWAIHTTLLKATMDGATVAVKIDLVDTGIVHGSALLYFIFHSGVGMRDKPRRSLRTRLLVHASDDCHMFSAVKFCGKT